MSKTEFGKGTAYCLGLFLCHSERASGELICDRPELWFNASSDHLYELQMTGDKSLDKRLRRLQSKCLHFGHGFTPPLPSEKDKGWTIDEAKNLLLLIDKKFLKVKTDKGSWR